jgi:hypothetical protein
MPDFVPDMRFMRGEGLGILADEHALAITFRGRVVYRTESPIIIRVALLTGQIGHRIYDMLHGANQPVDQVTHGTPQEQAQEEPQPRTQQPSPTVTILDQTKQFNRLILRLTLAGVYVTILVLRQIIRLVALIARASNITLEAPRPRAGRGRQRHQQQQQQQQQQQRQQRQERQRRPWSGSEEDYQRTLRIANSAREFQAVINAVSALVGPVPISFPREDKQFEDEAQPGVRALRVDRRVSVEVPDVEGAESQGLTTGTDQPEQVGAEQRRLVASRRGETTDDDDDDDEC